MDVTTGFFYLFSVVLLYAAFRVVTSPNPVHAVLHLMLAFSQAAGIWLLLKAEFLAIVLVMVYLGAVMVLFLFVVMMLDIRIDQLRKNFWKNFPLAAVIFAIVAFEMGVVLIGGFSAIDAPKAIPAVVDAAGKVVPYSNVKALGTMLYTEYLFPVQVAAVILLVAMIAAIALTLRQRKDSKAIDASLQVRVRAADRLQLVKVEASKPAAPVVPPAADAEEKKV
ncbi:NADH-quinone oxidoreductase subunit J [Comamonas sp. BIGb0152]|uniref:NADH-quinone oxidoreductase subunit J n=1 Tax=Comamonas sp. BIGb0152 TaxID=2940601 RepID=UPI00216A46B6|nr:NADH-quinone oxidoreductase subunit J [Comamonas sp. BIGb0152]MCS4295756.1 NADH-quinone oxidoreductase subunit J [Comamonas sp. BIGb0152]